MTWRQNHCNSEIRAQLNDLIKIYLYWYSPFFYLLNGPDISFKDAGLDSFDCEKFYMFNMNFTKDLVVVWNYRATQKSIIVVIFY